MSNQTKIKDLTLKLIDAEERCQCFMDSGILLSKRITELETDKAELIEFAKDNLKVICINCNNNVIKNCLCEMKQYNMRILNKYAE